MSHLNEKRFAHEQVKIFEDGDTLFLEGDDTREMYIVRSGTVVISKKTSHGEIHLAALTKGDFVGEMSLLETLPRSATARAKGKTEVLAIHPGGFLLKIRRDPTFAFEIMQTLSRRLRTTNERLMRAVESGHVSNDRFKEILSSAEFSKKDEAA